MMARAASIASSNSAATTTQTTSESIAPYATALNGVNQDLNNIFKESTWYSLGALAMLVLFIRLFQRGQAHLRHMTAMNMDAKAQGYFAGNGSDWWWKFKKHVLYAPLGKVRHNREMRLGAMHMGTIPGRFHFILIVLFWSANIGYCLALNYWRSDGYSIIAELRGRSGTLAVINMIALILLAGRNNPLISLLQVSFDTYNLIHRWIGRVVVIEGLVHTLCWAYVKIAATGWPGLFHQLKVDPFAYTGLTGTIAMLIILIQSLSPIRHAFYETFLDIHIILAVTAWFGVYYHCKIADLPQAPYVLAVAILWLLERTTRFFILLWRNFSYKGTTKAYILALPGEACRVTLQLPSKVTIKPGCHAYLRFTKINFWESHPFSIAWVEHKHTLPFLPISEKDGAIKVDDSDMVTNVSFVIQAQSGMTRRLYNMAQKCEGQGLTITAAFEGPYGGHHSLDSYGHCVLFAGASGITHQIGYVQHLVRGCHQRMIATRKITLIWIVRDGETFEWVRPWMEQILKMPGRRECLNIKLFVTRPKNSRDVNSPSRTVQVMSGRPKPKVILAEQVREQVGAMAVTVCGPGSLTDSVREAVREVQSEGVVDFIEESFSW